MGRLLLVLGLLGGLWGQQVPPGFGLGKALGTSTAFVPPDTLLSPGLASNGIVDIIAAGDSLLFFGTSRGLSLTTDLGASFLSYVDSLTDLPRGGISALNLVDSTVAVAGLVDTVISGMGEVMGAGLAFSTDLGGTWTYVPQPQDPPGEEFTTFLWADSLADQLAVTTTIRNVTFDVAISKGTIWAASWASGLRRYHMAADTGWSTVALPLDGDSTMSCDSLPAGYVLNARDPGDGGNHNHKAFSVMAYDSLVWVGTAAGLNKGIIDAVSGCITWTHFTAQWHGLSGNWVVALHRQVTAGSERIWAATVNAEAAGELRGVSFTEDGGLTWRVTLLGERVNNFATSGDVVYAATDNGLYKSLDARNWALFESAVDAITGEQVWAEKAWGALYDPRDGTLWIGTPDGLASTQGDGPPWRIDRSFVSTADSGEVPFYAYPNPFYLAEDNFRDGQGHVRFQYNVTPEREGRSASIAIFDFAMDPVIVLPARQHPMEGDFSQVWDGRNKAGHQVANGVYYCRLKLGPREDWTKVMVIK